MPIVWWGDVHHKVHRYYVDIFIPNENRMIEVKSNYTYEKDGVQEKKDACLRAGFTYEIWIY